jgi:hypothetical protein
MIILFNIVFLEAAACTWLWFRCEHRQRFTYIGTTAIATYVMFDTKTAQACWAGPPGPYTIESPDGKQKQETNGANIPFCKDLK